MVPGGKGFRMFGGTGTMRGPTCKAYLVVTAPHPPPEQMTSGLHRCGQVACTAFCHPDSLYQVFASVACVCVVFTSQITANFLAD